MIPARRDGWLSCAQGPWCAEGNGVPRGKSRRDPSTTPASGASQYANREHPRNRWWDRSDALLPPSVPIHYHLPYFSYALASSFFRYNSGGKYREVNSPYIATLASFVRCLRRSGPGAGHRHRRQILIHIHVDVYICMYQICLIGLCQGTSVQHSEPHVDVSSNLTDLLRTHTCRNLLL